MGNFLHGMIGAAIFTAIIFRIGPLREIVTGLKTDAPDAANPSAPRRLYV